MNTQILKMRSSIIGAVAVIIFSFAAIFAAAQDGDNDGGGRRGFGFGQGESSLELALANVGTALVNGAAENPLQIPKLNELAVFNDIVLLNARAIQARLSTVEQVSYLIMTKKLTEELLGRDPTNNFGQDDNRQAATVSELSRSNYQHLFEDIKTERSVSAAQRASSAAASYVLQTNFVKSAIVAAGLSNLALLMLQL